MKFFALTPLKKYIKLFRRVAQKYLDHLNHRSLMAGKLSEMIVCIWFSDEDANIPTHGDAGLAFKNNRVTHRVNLYINTHDSDKQIASVIAHELAHILFAFSNDYLGYGAESKSGCISADSSFKRKDSANGELFGVGLEEGAAETLARYIISHCRLSDSEGSYAKENEPDTYFSMLTALTESLANCFGTSVYSSKYIDGLSVEKFIVEKGHPLYEEMEDSYDNDLWKYNRHFYQNCVANPFWYSAVTNTFHCMLETYDEYMGKGAFRELCKHFDGLYTQYYEHSEEPGAYELALEHKEKAEEMIREFNEKYQSRPREQLGGMEAKYEQYVEEQKKTANRL